MICLSLNHRWKKMTELNAQLRMFYTAHLLKCHSFLMCNINYLIFVIKYLNGIKFNLNESPNYTDWSL